MKLIVTGGAGFIGSAFVRLLLSAPGPYEITVLDKLTYAGNLDNLAPIADDSRYTFVQADIADGAMTFSYLDGWWTDAGTFESLLRANNLVAETIAKKAEL